MSTAEDAAKAFLVSVQDKADIGGPHYAPCFRDCLGDNMEWVAAMLAEFINEQRREAEANAFDETRDQ